MGFCQGTTIKRILFKYQFMDKKLKKKMLKKGVHSIKRRNLITGDYKNINIGMSSTRVCQLRHSQGRVAVV